MDFTLTGWAAVGYIHYVSTWSELMSCVTSFTADELKESFMLLSNLISPICQLLGRITSSGPVFMIVQRRYTSNVLLKILSTGTTKRFCCGLHGMDGSMRP